MLPHYLLCNSPICQDDFNSNYKKEVVWYPGESICTKKPYKKFQRVQIEINDLLRKGKFRNINKPYTAEDLEDGRI